jgi:tetratricopeptide (TPR) repeat protein
MSIIHEALKKAEREREPLPRGVPARHLVSPRTGRWRGRGLARLLSGMMIGGGIGVAIWLQLGGVLPLGSAPPPDAPAISPDDEVRTTAGILASHTSVHGERAWALPSDFPEVLTPAPHPSPADLAAAQAGVQATFEQAVHAEAEGRWEEAVHYYRQALAQAPGLLKAHNNLGNLYIRQQRFPEAIAQFQAALTLAPEYAYARNNLGSAYLLLGQEAEAIQEFLAALRLDGSYVSPYYNLAAIYARRGDLVHVMAFLTKAIALEPAVLSWLGEDADFDRVRAAPAFRQLGRSNHARR